MVHIRDAGGALHTARALLDLASHISAITTRCASRLGFRITRWTTPVSGLSGVIVSNVQGVVDYHIQPRFYVEPVMSLKTWVITQVIYLYKPSLTSHMPRFQLPRDTVDKYRNLTLANPSLICY